jgi:hypothetical protein
MEGLERYVRKYADPGAAISLVTLVRIFWQTNHYGDPKWGFVPDTVGSVTGIVFSLQRNSTPGALRPFLTDEHEDSNVNFFFRDHKGTTILRAVHYAEEYIRENPMGRLSVRLAEDESAVKDFFYYMLGPLLPPRSESMVVQVAQTDEFKVITGYTRDEPQQVGEWTEPLEQAEVEANVIRTIVLLGGRTAAKKKDEITRDSLLLEDLEIRGDKLKKIAKKLSHEFDYRVESITQTPEQVAETWFTVGDIVDRVVERSEYLVLERWTNPDLGVTAEKIRYCRDYCPYELWVKGEKFRDSSFNPQPTGSWTRGAEFVLAGGVMGTFAAVNEEVERSHVANILLIFLIVLTFVSTSYRSLSAGAIIMFSLATGTVMSLFYMALRGTAWGSAWTTRSTSPTGSGRSTRGAETWTRGSGGRSGPRGWRWRSRRRRWSGASGCGSSRTCVSRRRWPSCFRFSWW